jgi:hypothetical protein
MVHPASLKFLGECLRYAADIRKMDEGALFQYFMTTLSVTLQKQLATALLEGSIRVNGNDQHRTRTVSHYSYQRVEDYNIVHASALYEI